MDIRIEMRGSKAVCHQDGKEAMSLPIEDWVKNLIERSEPPAPAEAMPDGVRFLRRRGEVTMLVLEEKPALRTVLWLAQDSPAPYGPQARYRSVRIALPFIVLFIGLANGEITGKQQCFYRTAPLRSLDDELLLPNLLNVARAYGMDAWLCLQHLRNRLGPLPFNEKINEIWRHVLNSGWNGSSERHEGMSYFGEMRGLDKRIASIEEWERASAADPYFPLSVAWQPAGKTVGQVMGEMLDMMGPPFAPATAEALMPLMGPRRKRAAKQWSLFAK